MRAGQPPTGRSDAATSVPPSCDRRAARSRPRRRAARDKAVRVRDETNLAPHVLEIAVCTKEASVLFSGQIDALSDGFICGFDIGAGAKREKQLKPCATRGGGRTAVECRAQSN